MISTNSGLDWMDEELASEIDAEEQLLPDKPVMMGLSAEDLEKVLPELMVP